MLKIEFKFECKEPLQPIEHAWRRLSMLIGLHRRSVLWQVNKITFKMSFTNMNVLNMIGSIYLGLESFIQIWRPIFRLMIVQSSGKIAKLR